MLQVIYGQGFPIGVREIKRNIGKKSVKWKAWNHTCSVSSTEEKGEGEAKDY